MCGDECEGECNGVFGMTKEDQYKVVHLFSPYAHHEEQGIIGNKDGLKALITLIQEAIDIDMSDAPFFVSDGEGYDLFVKCISDKLLNKVALPYTANYAEEDREDAIYPWGPGGVRQ
jgi:hypothetical protein